MDLHGSIQTGVVQRWAATSLPTLKSTSYTWNKIIPSLSQQCWGRWTKDKVARFRYDKTWSDSRAEVGSNADKNIFFIGV